MSIDLYAAPNPVTETTAFHGPAEASEWAHEGPEVAAVDAKLRTAGFTPSDRRRLPRLACDLPVHCLSMDDWGFFHGRVENVSLGGARIQTHRPLNRGQVVKLKPGKRMAGVPCRVVWISQGHAGLQFVSSPTSLARSWVLGALHRASEITERRRHIRVPAELPARCAGLDCVVRDLSLGGCKFETRRPFSSDGEVRLEIGCLEGLSPLALRAWLLRSRRGRLVWRHQLEFRSLSKQQTTLLGRYLAALIRANRASLAVSGLTTR